MKSNTYDNPRDEAIAGLEETLGKIQSYQRHITRTEPSNTRKQRHEQEKAESIKAAIAFMKRCPPNGSCAPNEAPGGQQQ